MNKIPSIQNVMSFKCNNELCLFFDRDDNAYLNNEKVQLPQFNIDNQSSAVFGDFYSIQSKSGETALYSGLGNRLILETEYTLVKNFNYNKRKILFSEKTDKRRHRKFHLYDIKGNCFSIKGVNSFQVNHSFFKENWLFFSNSLLKISNLHLPTETTLWQYDTSVLGIEKIGKILGVFGEVLVVEIRIGLNDLGLIALNINNGQLVWQQMFSKSGLGLNLSHSTEHNTLISLGAFSIWEFDLLEQKVIRDKGLAHKLVYNDKPFKISSATLDQGKFYFVAQYVGQSMSSALLGIFNTETEELEWIHDFEGKVHLGGNARPKVGGNKIYTLDNDNTLHIFERVL